MLQKLYFFPLALLLFLGACTGEAPQEQVSEPETPGGRNYGGVFRINENEYFVSLFPHHIADEVSWRITAQVYEGLFKFNPVDLSVEKCLIQNFSVDSSQTLYTFTLKKGVQFHDNACFPKGAGRELVASDVIYSFTQLCRYAEDNIGASVFKDMVVGAADYYEASRTTDSPEVSIEGFKELGQYRFQIKLNKPHHTLPYILAGPLCFIYPPEAYEKYGKDMRIHAVGTGPFFLDAHSEEDFKVDSHLLLRRNATYHQQDEFGNQLPFLDMIEVTFVHDKHQEMEAFKKGKYHSIYRLPTEDIIHLMDPENHELDDFAIQDVAEYSTHYIGYNNHTGPFSDIHLRKALNFAINRSYLIDMILDGEADEPGNHGITPLAFADYEASQIKGYVCNPDSAKHYFNLSSYAKSGSSSPLVLNLTSDGERNASVAQDVKRQLKEILNLEIQLHYMELPELEAKIELGEIDFFLTGWLYQYPHPENFLNAFYSKNAPLAEHENAYPNLMRYVNTSFDASYEQGMYAPTDREAFVHFHEAEQILMKDAAICPLWYDEGYSLFQPFVQNYHINPLQYRDFREVYFRKADVLEMKE